MEERIKFVIFDRRETLFESLAADAVTFGLLLLLAYVSRDSACWLLVAGGAALLWLGGKLLQESARRRQRYFRSKEELIAWANAQDEDGGVA